MKKGFTLLEILIAIIILTVGVVSITSAFSTGIYASADIENVNTALNIAQAKMEEIKNTAYAGIINSGPASDANFTNFNITISVTESLVNLKSVNTKVEWQVKGGQANVTLATLIANY